MLPCVVSLGDGSATKGARWNAPAAPARRQPSPARLAACANPHCPRRPAAPQHQACPALLRPETDPFQVMFVNGVAVDRIVGFDQLGASDDFPTSTVRLLACSLLRSCVAASAVTARQTAHAPWRPFPVRSQACATGSRSFYCFTVLFISAGGEEATKGGRGAAAAAAKGRLGRRGGAAACAHDAQASSREGRAGSRAGWQRGYLACMNWLCGCDAAAGSARLLAGAASTTSLPGCLVPSLHCSGLLQVAQRQRTESDEDSDFD